MFETGLANIIRSEENPACCLYTAAHVGRLCACGLFNILAMYMKNK